MKPRSFSFLFLIFCLALSACNLPGRLSPDVSAVATSAAETVFAVLTPSATPTGGEVLASPPAASPTPSLTPTPCQDSAQYTTWTRNNVVYDAKESAKGLVPGATFSMAWTLKNIGTCTWNSSYRMVVDSGTALTQATSFPVLEAGKTVAPGATLSVQIEMTAPAKTGDYQTTLSLKNELGADAITLGIKTRVGKTVSQAPSSPGNLQYTYDCTSGSVNISLTWVDRASDEDAYRVYRDGSLVDELPAGSTSYTETVPAPGSYDYKVSAVNASGESSAGISVNTANCK